MTTISRSSSGAKRIDGGRHGGRVYRLPDGREYPSVTSILTCIGKPALITWAANTERTLVSQAAADLYEDCPLGAKMKRLAFLASLDQRLGKLRAHQRENQKAIEIGSQAHALVEWNLRKALGQVPGPEPRITDKATWAFMAWQDWWGSAGLTPVSIEQTIWHDGDEYAGTMDLLARDLSGELVLIDFKTSKAIYGEAFLQTAAYAEAVNAMGHGPVKKARIVRLPKAENDPAFEVREVEDLAGKFQVFRHVHALWKWSSTLDTAWRTAQERGEKVPA